MEVYRGYLSRYLHPFRLSHETKLKLFMFPLAARTSRTRILTGRSRNVAASVGYTVAALPNETEPECCWPSWLHSFSRVEGVRPTSPAESFHLRRNENPFGGSKHLLFPGQRPNTKGQPGCRLVYSNLSAKQQSWAAPEYRERASVPPCP